MLAPETADNQQEMRKKQQGHREQGRIQVKIFWKELFYSARILKYVCLEILNICIWWKWLKFQADVGLNIYSATYLLALSLGKKLEYFERGLVFLIYKMSTATSTL